MTEDTKVPTIQYLKMFFRRRGVFFAVLCIMPLIVFNVSNFLPKYYEASTLIKVNDEQLLNPLLGDIAVSSTVHERLKSVEEEILTWSNLSAITRGLDLEKNVRTQMEYEKMIISMRKAITVKMISRDIIKITYRGKDPYEVKEVTDRISDLFIKKNVSFQNNEADQATDFITQQLNIYQKKLDESERVFSRFRLINQLKNSQKKRKVLEGQLKLQPKEIVSQTEKRENPLVGKLKMQLIDQQVQLANLLVDATESHPQVKQLRSDIAKTKEELADSIKNPQTIETRTINPVYQDLKQKIKDIDFEINNIKTELAVVNDLNGNYESKGLPEQELASLARDNRVNEHLYETLLAKLETANITKRLEDSKGKTTFSVIEKARLPLNPVSPQLPQVMLYGIFLSIISAVCAVMGLEYIDNSFKDTYDAKAFLNKPVLGAIPLVLTYDDAAKRGVIKTVKVILVLLVMFFLLSTGLYFYVR